MAVFKCKMCGGNIEFNPGDSIGVCDSCGTTQTLPKASDDAISSLYNRANTLRIKSEFDRAEEMYNKIITADETQAEAYWGIILCKYGIEYVEDPKTFKRVPTCHRASFDSVSADSDFKLALKYGDAEQKKIYRAEAKAIDSIQKDILKIANNEKPFDVFLCYKETDDSGKRTQDSVIANDIYHQLIQEGFKVFYAAITLEDKLGQEYEPYIFAALNSAKVMLVIGSKPEYFTAVWVKNEWSRFLKLMKNDRSKLLIPCYKDMDAYELPDEFAHLQAQDMSKIGFINDVVRGIKKVVTKDSEPAAVSVPVAAESDNSITPLLKRAFMFLEDGSFDEADEYCERVLDKDPENAEAYLGKLMAELKVRKQEDLKNCGKAFDTSSNYQKAVRFGDDNLVEQLKSDIESINIRNEEARLADLYQATIEAMNAAYNEKDFLAAADKFKQIQSYKDAADCAEACIAKAEELKQERLKKEEEDRLEAERKAEEERIQKKKVMQLVKKYLKIVLPCIAVIVILIIVLINVIIPSSKYYRANHLMENNQYEEAISSFESLNGYKDSKEKMNICYYQLGISAFNSKKFKEALDCFEQTTYEDSELYLFKSRFYSAEEYYSKGQYETAISLYKELTKKEYFTEEMNSSIYAKADKKFKEYVSDYTNENNKINADIASELFTIIEDYENSKELKACLNVIMSRIGDNYYFNVLLKIKQVCSDKTYDSIVRMNDKFTAINNLLRHVGIYKQTYDFIEICNNLDIKLNIYDVDQGKDPDFGSTGMWTTSITLIDANTFDIQTKYEYYTRVSDTKNLKSDIEYSFRLILKEKGLEITNEDHLVKAGYYSFYKSIQE